MKNPKSIRLLCSTASLSRLLRIISLHRIAVSHTVVSSEFSPPILVVEFTTRSSPFYRYLASLRPS